MRNRQAGAFIVLKRLPLRLAGAVIAFVLLAGTSASSIGSAQDLSTGALNVTVVDPSGAVVNGAQLVLKDLETNDIHNAATRGAGNAVLSFLNPAHYSLTVTKDGFQTEIYPSVTIQTNQVTDLKVTLTLV
jgi:hypothetical protein